MNLLKYFLFLPIVFSAISINENRKINETKIQEGCLNEIGAYAPTSDDNQISVDLKLDPYYKTDNFVTVFHYYGTVRPIKCWTKEEGVYVKLNDKFLPEKGDVEAEVFCYKEKGLFTFYVMNEEEDISEIKIVTRLTDYGVFACINSEEACENMVIDYEINNGIISQEKSEYYLDYGDGSCNSSAPSINLASPGKTIIQGKIEWEDWQNKIHPARGVKIKFIEKKYSFEAWNYSRHAYTKDDGSYTIEIDNSHVGNHHSYLKLSSETEHTTVGRFLCQDTSYFETYPVTLEKGLTNNADVLVKYSESLNKHIQIASCIHLGEEYFKTAGLCNPPHTHVVHPFECFSLNSFSAFTRIALNREDFENWDTILHEYGHTIESSLNVFACIPWKHKLKIDYTGDFILGKEKALKLSYQEGLASVFSIAIQRTFSNILTGEFNVGDTYYDGIKDVNNPNYHNSERDLENIDSMYIPVGEANEQTAMRFLYDLWDTGDNESYDNVALGNKDFWNLIKNSKALTISDLVQFIRDNRLIDEDSLGQLLEFYHFAPSNIRTYKDPLSKYFWTKSGNIKNVETSWNWNGKSPTIGKEYILRFYSANDVFLFEHITDKDFDQISSSEWETIINEPGSTYKVKIGAKTTGAYETGPYFAKTREYHKSHLRFDPSSVDQSAFNNNTTGTVNLPLSSYVSSISWKDVTKITNVNNNDFFCLNAGAASYHKSILRIQTWDTFKSVTFDLIYKNYNARPLDTTIEVHKCMDGFWYECAEIDGTYVGMDVDYDGSCQSFTFSMGGDANGFEIYVIGYGETALCVSNISFDVI